jgi:hypothetical protein
MGQAAQGGERAQACLYEKKRGKKKKKRQS